MLEFRVRGVQTGILHNIHCRRTVPVLNVLSSFKVKRLTPNDHYSGCTAPLTSKRCILYIYSTNIDNEYLNMVYTLRFFSLSSKCSLFHNSNVFGSCFIHILYTECAKI